MVLFARPSGLLVETTPFRAAGKISHVREYYLCMDGDLLVDSINVVLGFDCDASVTWDELVLALYTLRALELGLSVVPVASIQDHCILVGGELSLDAAEFTAESERDVFLVPLVVECQGAVVAVAAVAAVVLKVGVSRGKPKLVGFAPEVVDIVLGNLGNFSRGKRVPVGLQRPLSLRGVQGVVPDGPVGWVLESIELEVCVLRKHQRRLLVWRFGIHDDAPLVLGYSVCHRGIDIADHSKRRVGRIMNRERYGLVGHICDVPEAERPVVRSTVESVRTVVLLGDVGFAV